MTKTTDLSAMTTVVLSHGAVFSGGSDSQAAEIAEEWLDHDFDESSADRWMDTGFWDPSTAAQIRDAGITASKASELAESLAESEPEGTFTDGCPIYAMCNCDYNVAEFIEAYNAK